MLIPRRYTPPLPAKRLLQLLRRHLIRRYPLRHMQQPPLPHFKPGFHPLKQILKVPVVGIIGAYVSSDIDSVEG